MVLGTSAIGLLHEETMMTAFKMVVDYGYCQLVNRTVVLVPSDTESMYKLKKQVDGLYTTLKVFDGFQPIKL